MSALKFATKFVKVALFLAIVALFVCAAYISRVGCPACLAEFAGNSVRLDVLALELPTGGDELRGTLYLGKPFSQTVRDVYAKQTNVDDVFLWLYPAQFVLGCFYFALTSEVKPARLLLLAANLAMIWAGWLDHRENSFIHAILSDSGSHLNQLAREVSHVSMQKWLCFGVADLLAATGLVLQIGDRRPEGLTGSATGVLCAALISTCSLLIVGRSLCNRNIVGWSAIAFSIFPLAMLWLLYLKPWAESLDARLRSRLGLQPRLSSGTM